MHTPTPPITKIAFFMVSSDGVSPSEKNLNPIKTLQVPGSQSEIRRVLRAFGPNSVLTKDDMTKMGSLKYLLKKGAGYIYIEKCQAAFDFMKDMLLRVGVGTQSMLPSWPFYVAYDASDNRKYAFLYQKEDGNATSILASWGKAWNSKM